MRSFLPALCLSLCLDSSSRADWPHLRGPNYDGVSAEKNLADSWPKEGPPVLWSRELGQGHSGFVVAAGKLYTQRQTPRGQYILCLDPNNGQTIWETRVDWPWQPGGMYPGPYATPTWYRDKIYYASPTGLVGCLDARTGTSIWSLNVREKFQGKGLDFGFAATPLVEEDRVILPVGGENASLVALRADDGRTLWATGSDPASYCPAFPIDFEGRRCVVGYLQNAFVLVDSATGKELHRHVLSDGYDEHSAWPLYREPDLLLLAPFGKPAGSWRLRANDEGALLCDPQWTNRELCNDVISSVLHDGHVFGFHLKQQQASGHKTSRGLLKCLEWTTGKVRWSTDRVGHAALLPADGKLFLLNDTGTLILARADPDEYRELGRVSLFEDEICWTPPTLSQGRLFVRSPSKAVCVYVGRPEDRRTADVTNAPARWRFDPAWLLSRGREFPNDPISQEEAILWFVACLLILTSAAGATAFVRLAAWHRAGKRVSALVFLGTAFVVGFLGPNALSALFERCLFTWPVCLYAALHGTVLACMWGERHQKRWLARLALAGFLLVCYGYFEGCRTIGMFIAWGFLFGFVPAAPLTYFAARAASTGRRTWIATTWTLLAFAALYWGSLALLWWKSTTPVVPPPQSTQLSRSLNETYFVSKYASSPSWANSRPKPLSFMPPKGHCGVDGTGSLMPIMPDSKPSAMRQAMLRSFVKT